MGQPTQRATNYTARSNIDTAQIFLHANGQRQSRKKKIRAYGATRLYTHSHELPALTALAQHISHSHSGIDEMRPTEFVFGGNSSLLYISGYMCGIDCSQHSVNSRLAGLSAAAPYR